MNRARTLRVVRAVAAGAGAVTAIAAVRTAGIYWVLGAVAACGILTAAAVWALKRWSDGKVYYTATLQVRAERVDLPPEPAFAPVPEVRTEMKCLCGDIWPGCDDDSECAFYEYGYEFCPKCDDHHRPPVCVTVITGSRTVLQPRLWRFSWRCKPGAQDGRHMYATVGGNNGRLSEDVA